MSDECPEFIGSYKIVKPLGVGGMGRVYEARHKSLNIPVAIKVFFQNVDEKPKLAKRFIQEARLAASIEHINLVRVLECGNDEEGHPYYVMEKMDSNILIEMKKNGKYGERDAIDIGESVSRGMKTAHLNGIIHRDIKPDNIMISGDGLYKVGDLGLAKLILQESEALDPNMTVTNTGLGTPHFMAPEQAINAAEVDERADVFSLGASLYFMVTNTKPFAEGGIQSIINDNYENGAPDPSDHNPDLSEDFCKMVQKCMAYKSEDRYQSMDELNGELVKLRHCFHDSVKPIHFNTCFDLSETTAAEIAKIAKYTRPQEEVPEKKNKISLYVILMLISVILILALLLLKSN